MYTLSVINSFLNLLKIILKNFAITHIYNYNFFYIYQGFDKIFIYFPLFYYIWFFFILIKLRDVDNWFFFT